MDLSILSKETFTFPTDVCRLEGPTSVLVGSNIYVDGGQARVQHCGGGGCSRWTDNCNYVWTLSLKEAFSVENIPIQSFVKPQAVPQTVRGALWHNKLGTELYTYGGSRPFENTSTVNYQEVAWPVIWGYNISANTWFNIPSSYDTFEAAWDAAYYSVPDSDLSFAIGGTTNFETIPTSSNSWPGPPDPGVMTFTSSNFTLTNNTAPGAPNMGRVSKSNLVYVPYGSEGVLMLLGGNYVTADGVNYSASTFDQIYMFDIASRTWLSQRASADAFLPNPRHNACAAVASSNSTGTVDVFLLGGDPDCGSGSVCDSEGSYSRGIDILSLPSFRWFHYIDDPNVSTNSSFSGDVCHVVGNHILRVGGWNAWLNGVEPPYSCRPLISILDLGNLTWTQSFDPSAAEYKTPSKINEWAATNTTPLSGWNAGVQSILFPTASGTASAQPSQLSTSNTETSNHVGVIVGCVIGGILLVVALALTALILRTRRKMAARNISQQNAPTQPSAELHSQSLSNQTSELPNQFISKTVDQYLQISSPTEMTAHHGQSELPGRTIESHYELPGSNVQHW